MLRSILRICGSALRLRYSIGGIAYIFYICYGVCSYCSWRESSGSRPNVTNAKCSISPSDTSISHRFYCGGLCGNYESGV